jgi:cell wall-associated NlpC family hydrolase
VANRIARRVLVSVAAVAACATAIVVPSVAHAAPQVKPTPKPTVASVEAQLAKLAKQNTQLVEQYDEAQLAVAGAQKSVGAAKAKLAVANAAVAAAGVELSRSALAEYEGGAFSTAGALLSSNGGSSYLDTIDTMQMISVHSVQVVSAYQIAGQNAASAKSQADHALTSAAKTRDSVAAQQANVRAATLPLITSAQAREAVKFALLQVGKPYFWGAAGPGSYDCSGLTMVSYRAAGINLPHSAAAQYHYGKHVTFSQLQPGDLMFFYHPIGHVTIYVGDGLMVSAPESNELVKVMPANAFGSDFVGATRLVSS